MSEDNSNNHSSAATHQGPQSSTTLNRRYVHRPEPMAKKARKESAETAEAVAISSFAKCQAENLKRRQELAEKINQERMAAMRQKRAQRARVEVEAVVEKPVDNLVEKSVEKTQVHKPAEAAALEEDLKVQELAIQKAANQRLAQTWEKKQADQPTAQQLKDEAIKKAMRSVATMEAKEKKERKKHGHRKMSMHRKKRVAVAILSAVAVVAAFIYFVSVNMPDVSMRVTALTTGIENPYPSYVPRGFTMVTSSSGENNVSMTFADGETAFVLNEEKSTWDSKALLSNYVELKWRSYDTVREQGLTIYISGSNAAWVNGGVRYTIEAQNGALTKKQITSIATSL